MNSILLMIVCVILLKTTVEWILLELNRRHALKIHQNCPEYISNLFDVSVLKKSVDYTVLKIKFNKIEIIVDGFIIIAILMSEFISKSFNLFLKFFPESAFTYALYVFFVGFIIHLLKLPLEWFWQFRIEQKLGFNTATQKLWIFDQIKIFLISLILTVIVVGTIYYLCNYYPEKWAFYAFAFIVTLQIILTILAPKVILPMFNKFSPLSDYKLKEKLLILCKRANFPISSIEIVDGSKRSKHSNAFFIGFGKFRKIVLYDTLIQQLSEDEIVAVTAHEIGHYKYRHIVKSFFLSALSTGIGLFIIHILSKSDWFYSAFGLPSNKPILVMLILILIGGSFTFWFTPIIYCLSRKWEYQADSFAVQLCGNEEYLTSALKKLTEKNLSNLFPHPLYSAFYYSHPNLIDRIENINRD
ncbi:MAG: M48 family metallopeptidase [Verrucomicrobiia bacterium]|jgi:STE24 endopeptidase